MMKITSDLDSYTSYRVIHTYAKHAKLTSTNPHSHIQTTPMPASTFTYTDLHP